MAAPADNLLSLRHRTQNKNTFTQHHDVKRRATHLQLYLQELKDRERRAQEHNSQLLQQFEEAQVALKEMLARTAAMKTIRREYERYLEDNSSRWQQQLQQQTQAAQIKRTVDSVSSYLRKTEENQVLACTVDTSLLSQGPSIQKSVAPRVCSTQENSNYNQDTSSHHPYAEPSWLTSSFLRASHQSYNPLLSPPHTFLHPHLFLPQHFTFTPGHQQPWSRQDDAGEDPEPCAAGIPPEEPPASRGEEHEETSGEPKSNREHKGGNRSCSSPDLDIKPVRLLSHHAGSSESDRDSSLVCREKTKKEKRGRTQQSSSDSESHASQKTTNKTPTASFLRPHSSESDTSSEGGNAVPDASLQSEEEAKEQTKSDEEESQHTCEGEGSSNEVSPSEKVGDQSHADESESSGSEQESGKSDRKNKTRAAEETDDQEQSNVKKKDGDGLKNPGPAEQEETKNSQSEEQGSDEEDDDEEVSLTGKSEEEAEDRMEDQVEKKQGSASSQDEEDENSEDEEGSHDEDQGEETGEEGGDSEDIIISPQNKRPEQIQIISEGAEDEENKSQSSIEISDEDIENLLMPQEQTQEMDLKANEEPKVIYHNMDIFQVAKEKTKTGDKSDSDEFDHFYD